MSTTEPGANPNPVPESIPFGESTLSDNPPANTGPGLQLNEADEEGRVVKSPPSVRFFPLDVGASEVDAPHPTRDAPQLFSMASVEAEAGAAVVELSGQAEARLERVAAGLVDSETKVGAEVSQLSPGMRHLRPHIFAFHEASAEVEAWQRHASFLAQAYSTEPHVPMQAPPQTPLSVAQTTDDDTPTASAPGKLGEDGGPASPALSPTRRTRVGVRWYDDEIERWLWRPVVIPGSWASLPHSPEQAAAAPTARTGPARDAADGSGGGPEDAAGNLRGGGSGGGLEDGHEADRWLVDIHPGDAGRTPIFYFQEPEAAPASGGLELGRWVRLPKQVSDAIDKKVWPSCSLEFAWFWARLSRSKGAYVSWGARQALTPPSRPRQPARAFVNGGANMCVCVCVCACAAATLLRSGPRCRPRPRSRPGPRPHCGPCRGRGRGASPLLFCFVSPPRATPATPNGHLLLSERDMVLAAAGTPS